MDRNFRKKLDPPVLFLQAKYLFTGISHTRCSSKILISYCSDIGQHYDSAYCSDVKGLYCHVLTILCANLHGRQVTITQLTQMICMSTVVCVMPLLIGKLVRRWADREPALLTVRFGCAPCPHAAVLSWWRLAQLFILCVSVHFVFVTRQT